MLKPLNNLLRAILLAGVADLRPNPPAQLEFEQVGFRPPDATWVSDVRQLDKNALNLYLVDLRENRKLRSNDYQRTSQNGTIIERPAPGRMDCHYLLSAWSPAVHAPPTVDPVSDEHELLYQAAAVMMNSTSINPSRIYAADKVALGKWPLRFQDCELPVAVAPVEGFPKLAEFWGTMGTDHRWKPALYLIVNVPVEMMQLEVGHMVTTRITEYGITDGQGPTDVWVQIGGTVTDRGNNPIAGAWIRLETRGDDPLQTTTSDKDGRFTFGELQPGPYQLRVRASSLGELTPVQQIDVPSPTGHYDIQFS